LLLSLLVGTYSSVFAATPLAVTLQAKSASGPPRTKSRAPEAAARRRARQSGSGAVV
jgi:SecD/SecF fusion protein